MIIHKKKGQTGLGKSTLINTLFASHLIDSKGRHNVEDVTRQTTEIEAVSHGKYRKKKEKKKIVF